MTVRADLTARIVATQDRLQRLLAADPANPLMRSTLTMQQLKALLVVSQTDGAAGQDLAAAMGVGLATVTGIVDRLVAAGMVERREDPKDRRVRRVLLTDAGRRTVDGIVTAGRLGLVTLLDRLAEDDLAVVEHAMQLLTAAAEQNACAPPAPHRA
ncbi:hypothetical protein Val02_11750 [Virgisporangium aliadipatigenens]|uniref:HTH marR-type domain-containing protein n=1 Tax=Virgisporangium aliadipatigenens TaxID=741659 RepID=A0A8J4DND4_9ACTN|nr:MarR family transcriptional regulator [Virgisporangium aliadipatigenens]GIJ44289.1 hypothetical protein Val02_11750 [Virgisporangium aliadipatigenens]